MQLMQQRMREIIPQIAAVRKDAAARIEAAAGSPAAAAQSAVPPPH